MKWIGQRTLNCWILSNHEKVKWVRKSLECMTCVFRFSICEVPHRHPAISKENFAWLLFITKQFSQRFEAHDLGLWACGLSFEALANTSRREGLILSRPLACSEAIDVKVLKIIWSTYIQWVIFFRFQFPAIVKRKRNLLQSSKRVALKTSRNNWRVSINNL